ncbi:MAG: RNA polymerase sigma factor RpoD/SigA [Armatimonadetes bacterium]|nr:RNA polymerase sigma factor RpoD/SigA [Armatimonadota bacterium]
MPHTRMVRKVRGRIVRGRSRARRCEGNDVKTLLYNGVIPRTKHPKHPHLVVRCNRRTRRPKRQRMNSSYVDLTVDLHSPLLDEQFIEGGLHSFEGLDEDILAVEIAYERSRDVAVEDPMAAWAKELRKRPLLTKEQEVELAKRIDNMKQALTELKQLKGEGNLTPERENTLQTIIEDGEAARKILIESNLRLVVSIARRYRGYGVPLGDLIQEGNIGLIQAVDKFDWRKGCRFSTCATLWIRQAVIRAIQAQAQPVKLPTRVSELIHRLNRVKEMLIQELGREPTSEELARRMRLSKETVEQLLCYPHQVTSLDEPFDTDEKGTLADAIEDENEPGPEEVAMRMHNRELIEQALDELPKNQRVVIRLRYGLEDGYMHTYEDIGKRLNLSRQRVKQIADAAIKRLKEHPLLRELDMEGFLGAVPVRTIGRRL